MEKWGTLTIIALLPLYGFGIGLHLDLIDSGEMFFLQNLVKNASVESRDNLLMSSAFMSGNGDGTIHHASIGLGLGKVLVDPDETKVGDEYFDNKINECIFHSDESIPDSSCIVCKIVDEEFEERCKDFWINFEGLEHGDEHQTVFDYLKDNFGITLTVNGLNGIDEAIIYDSRYLGDHGDPPSSTDVDVGCDFDLEHPLLPGDDPNVGNLLVMREVDTDQPDPCITIQPNDSSLGGTMMFVLDEPMYLESVDVVDHDDFVDDAFIEAHVSADCSDDTPIVADIDPKDYQNSLQKVVVNADDVSCFKIIYPDSGGFTNIHLRCIPCEGAWIDFEEDEANQLELDHGDGHQVVLDYLNDNFGITLSVDANGNRPDEVIIYDSRYLGPGPPIDGHATAGCDFDLEHPLVPDDDKVGNLIVMKENPTDCGQPNDSGVGGILTFVLDKPMYLESVDVVDHDNNGETSVIEAHESVDCTDANPVIADIVEFNVERILQRVFVNANNVSCFKIIYPDSGGFTNIHLTCVEGNHNDKKEINPETVIAAGILDLQDGYWASDTERIPLEPGADVFDTMGIALQVFKSNVDFEELAHGADHADVAAYLLDNFGITLTVEGINDIDEATIYDSEVQGGEDDDLDQPLFPEPDPIGKILIMKEDSPNQPNDSGSGGIIRYTTEEPMTYISMDVVDHEPGRFSEIRFYEEADCSDEAVIVDILPTEGADCSNDCHWATLEFEEDGEDVRCVEIDYRDSGGFANFHKACPSPSEWLEEQ